MADKNIGALPLAPTVNDDSLLVMEQQGQAMAVTGLLLKDYAKRGVEGEFQDDVDKANAAADRAEKAASAVVDMTVSAHASDTPTVSKSERLGVVNLDFGLPRGERGEQGIEGPIGPRGPQGTPGNGLTILGHYGTEQELRNAVKSPEVGDAYSVGKETPYDTYIFDGVMLDWINYGPFTGGGGGVLPDNVVTTDGGAVIVTDIGGGPHTIEFIDEEEEPLTAEDIVYQGGTVQDALENLFTSVSDGKEKVASAITDKGVPTDKDATFDTMANNIGKITTGGGDTSDATATAMDILGGKTAYIKTGKVEGLIPSLPAKEYNPTTQAQTISAGNYLAGTQTIKGDTNLVSSNIRKGVTLFGVQGAMTTAFQATVTVTVDAGAVVTATHEDKVTKVESLSTTGQVQLELPKEGQWTITAQRGVAQYNSVVINVTSSYSASLTAEVHIERLSSGTLLTTPRYGLAATTVGDYAIFGHGYNNISSSYGVYDVDAYDKDLTYRRVVTSGSAGVSGYQAKGGLAATTVGNYALFGGGNNGSGTYLADVQSYNSSLTRELQTSLSTGRYNLAATTIGDYALFAGGLAYSAASSATVDSYNKELTREVQVSLIGTRYSLSAASNENCAIFAGGYSNTVGSSKTVDAYDKTLSHTIPETLSEAQYNTAAALAGNYVVISGGTMVDAYDLFQVKKTAEGLSVKKTQLAATTLNGYAIFGGGMDGSSAINSVDIYDAFLTRTVADGISPARYRLAATTVGNYAIFAGGRTDYGLSGASDIYRHI